MNRQPNEYWLKYMILFSGTTLDRIVATARLYQMVPPDQNYLRELRDQLDESKPHPFRMTSSATRAWVRRQRVMSLATNEPAAVAARDALSDYKLRGILEALLLADMPIPEIVRYAHLIAGRVITQEMVDRFRHYFWNRELLSPAEWRDCLRDHPNGRTLTACYSQGPEFALWKLGYRVELTKQEILQNVLHESAMRFAELNTFNNGEKTAIAAKMWADNIFRAIDGLERTGDSVKQVVDELREVAIKLGRRDITSVENLRRLPKE